jgi:hypothetical protein
MKWKIRVFNLFPYSYKDNASMEIEKDINDFLTTINSSEVMVKVYSSIVMIFYKEG